MKAYNFKQKPQIAEGAAIAPPPQLLAEDARRLAEPTPSSEQYKTVFGGGLNAAARMMHKMGYKEGRGLGAQAQGMTTALRVEKSGHLSGRIINEHLERGALLSDESHLNFLKVVYFKSAESAAALEEENAQAALLQDQHGESITELLKSPSKVILLKVTSLNH